MTQVRDVGVIAAQSETNDVVEPARPSRMGAGQDPAKRQQILTGAQSVFMRLGFDATSMNDIVREAGVSKGTIYVYFNNKEDLFEALCDEYRSTWFAEFIQSLEKGFHDREGLIKFGVALVTLTTSVVAIQAQRIVLGVSERKPELAVRFYERGPKHGLMLLQNCLEKMVADGKLTVPDTVLATYQLSELFLAGLYRPRLFGAMEQPPSAEQIHATVESAVTLFFKAHDAVL